MSSDIKIEQAAKTKNINTYRLNNNDNFKSRISDMISKSMIEKETTYSENEEDYVEVNFTIN